MSGHNGTVYLVGGGTGDVELVTLKGARALGMADVILYDRLVNPLLLLLAPKEAELIYCGKLPDRHTLSQGEIERQMIAQASMGKTVVRLKGGDPAVFGRVGEEMRALEAESIKYEVIPGVTAASVASIYGGIPLTDRDSCRHVTLATAHSQSGLPIDYSSLVTGGTLAFYMGVANLPVICQQLSNDYCELPIAIITWGSYGRQKVVTGTIGTILDQGPFTNPSMIIIGDVVNQRQNPSWFERLPYFGRQLLLVSQKSIPWETIVDYSAQGADVWAMEVGPRDERFDELNRRYLTEHQWQEIIFLDDEQRTPSLLVEALNAIGLGESELMK